MTKAIAVLNSLLTQRKLKMVCRALDISYTFAHAVCKGVSQPSYKLIKDFTPIIHPVLWFEDADNEFIEKITSN